MSRAGPAAALATAGLVIAVDQATKRLVDSGIDRGDSVNIVGPDGKSVGCGVANYSSADLQRIKGRYPARVISEPAQSEELVVHDSCLPN